MSAVFEHFALLQRDSWEDIFELLFWGRSSGMTEGKACFCLLRTRTPGEGEGCAAWRGLAVELSIKHCLLRPDFASVDL